MAHNISTERSRQGPALGEGPQRNGQRPALGEKAERSGQRPALGAVPQRSEEGLFQFKIGLTRIGLGYVD